MADEAGLEWVASVDGDAGTIRLLVDEMHLQGRASRRTRTIEYEIPVLTCRFKQRD